MTIEQIASEDVRNGFMGLASEINGRLQGVPGLGRQWLDFQFAIIWVRADIRSQVEPPEV